MEKELIMNTQYIYAYIQRNNITKEDFAKKCGISLKELNDVYNQKNVDIVLVVTIVKVLNITSDTFTFRDKSYPKKILVI
ncbi:MAG: hypothetical protein IJ415_00370 [Clostridia bacterium]|nr:hypothetical protein [Clostridia bacterium]